MIDAFTAPAITLKNREPAPQTPHTRCHQYLRSSRRDASPGLQVHLAVTWMAVFESLYALTEQGAEIRRALEELGQWGAKLGRVGPPVHQRSIRAIAMALQAVLARAGDVLLQERVVIELEIDGELAEVILGQRPTVTARPSLEPDARMRASTPGISALLMGEPFDDSIFTHVSGDKVASERLVAAMS